MLLSAVEVKGSDLFSKPGKRVPGRLQSQILGKQLTQASLTEIYLQKKILERKRVYFPETIGSNNDLYINL